MSARQSRPLRVVQVSLHADPLRRGARALLAAWPTLSNVAAAASRAGVEVTVVQTAAAREVLSREDVDFHFVPGAHREWTRVYDMVSALSPDVVHTQGLSFPRAMRALARAARGAPVLAQDRGNTLPVGWRVPAWRFAHSALGGVAFTSQEQAEPWKRSRIFRSDLPVFEVLGGSTTFAPGNQADAQREMGMYGDPCVLWCGRLDANKDPLAMLDAVEVAATALPDLALWCCFGDAPLEAAVRARIAASVVLTRCVTLLGTRPHAELEMRCRAADLFVQTSHKEGGSFALIEALACGVTPIVTDIPSARRIVGQVGSLTPVGDSAALAAAIIDFAARDRVALRVRARAHFEHSLTYDTIGFELRAAYEGLLQ
ncbi:MAG: glycosyl transferase group 1 [Gemmatimonadetes bacterium]|nr:glycosyl transferase group 1 [Gemmatimonadota bacterium]